MILDYPQVTVSHVKACSSSSYFLPKTFSDAPEAFSAHAQAQSRDCFQGQPSTQGEMRELDKYPIPIL